MPGVWEGTKQIGYTGYLDGEWAVWTYPHDGSTKTNWFSDHHATEEDAIAALKAHLKATPDG